MREFQKIISMQILEKSTLDKVFYLPCFMDNRGRQYYSTLLSPTFYILFRNLYEFNKKSSFKNLEASEFYKKIMKYKDLVIGFNLTPQKEYVAIVLFIEIGKFFIKNTSEYIIKTDRIITLGIEKYKAKTINLNFDKTLYVEKIFYLLDKLIIEGEIENDSIIFKDATASGLQNYGILLGYKESMLEYLNINGDN